MVDEYMYMQMYRYSPSEVDWLVEEFLPENHETRGGCLSNHMKMLVFLRYMADPGYQVRRRLWAVMRRILIAVIENCNKLEMCALVLWAFLWGSARQYELSSIAKYSFACAS